MKIDYSTDLWMLTPGHLWELARGALDELRNRAADDMRDLKRAVPRKQLASAHVAVNELCGVLRIVC